MSPEPGLCRGAGRSEVGDWNGLWRALDMHGRGLAGALEERCSVGNPDLVGSSLIGFPESGSGSRLFGLPDSDYLSVDPDRDLQH